MMTGRLFRLRVAAATLMLLAFVAASARSLQEPQEKVLPNFHQVNVNLYRGAQPLSGGMKRLAALGIKTIINLRGESEGTRAEEGEARAAGLRYFNVPMADLSRPTDEQVERVLAIINDAQNWPVFVHCNHGKDRTGTIIACYRISHDGWTSEKAKAEAKRYGMSFVQLGMKNYIRDYYNKRRAGATRASRLENRFDPHDTFNYFQKPRNPFTINFKT